MRFTARQSAGADGRFAPDAFAASIGSKVPCTAGEHTITATVVDVQVAGDGVSAEVTYGILDGPVARALSETTLRSASFGFKDGAP